MPDTFLTHYAWFLFLGIQKTSGNNSVKFQLKRLNCLWEMIFWLHAPIKHALKTSTFRKSVWDTQLCLKHHKMKQIRRCALSQGYNTFEKCFADAGYYWPFLWKVWFGFLPFWESLLWRLLLGAPENFLKTFYRVLYLRCCPFRWYIICIFWLTILSLNMHSKTYAMILLLSLY
jgi:hypothetical protein